eukprot:TRINITY_DN12496_c0_g1_i11.p2 TRINITY_DN12496_c0_g1~~TRINITY_DN12496_c0_g1_i11.p2  ORF type:complete len:101 (-),score=2.79 TRINITY_DN12496_c0_g1_i11:311-613(-)
MMQWSSANNRRGVRNMSFNLVTCLGSSPCNRLSHLASHIIRFAQVQRTMAVLTVCRHIRSLANQHLGYSQVFIHTSSFASISAPLPINISATARCPFSHA